VIFALDKGIGDADDEEEMLMGEGETTIWAF